MPDYRPLGQQIAAKHNIPWWLFNAQISAESNWDPTARSPVGAQGLGQLMPETAKGLGVTNPNDPAQNLEGSAKYLQGLYNQFGNWKLALAAYNAGSGNVQKYGGVPPFQETQNYVSKILSARPQAGQPGGGIPSAPARDPGVSSPVTPLADPSITGMPAQPGTTGPSLQALLDFAKPSEGSVKILDKLGGMAGRAAQAGQEDIPLPIPKTIAELQGTRSPKGDGPIRVQLDHSEPISPTATTVIKQAEQYLGTPYLWGGADPRKGFDCSGFVQYLYGQQGVSLPRTTYQQVKVGQAIHDPAALQAGDIVFFSSKGDVHHEGLYIGNGQFIHAPHTGDVVKISSLNEPYYKQQFFVGRRVTTQGGQS